MARAKNAVWVWGGVSHNELLCEPVTVAKSSFGSKNEALHSDPRNEDATLCPWRFLIYAMS